MKYFDNTRIARGFAAAALMLLGAAAALGRGPCYAAEEEPGKALVVYPSSATSKTPETIAAFPSAIRPVPEKEDYDPETPLGQVRTILQTLTELRTCDRSLASAFERLESTLGARLDATRSAVDANTERLSGLESALTGLAPRLAPPSQGEEPAPRAPMLAPNPGRLVAPLVAQRRAGSFWRLVALALAAVLIWEYARRRGESRDR